MDGLKAAWIQTAVYALSSAVKSHFFKYIYFILIDQLPCKRPSILLRW